MIRLLHGAISRAIAAGVAILILAAVLINVARLALPLAGHWRGDVAAAISARVGVPVRIDALWLGLAGLSPRLVLEGVTFGRPGGGPDLLQLDGLELDLDLLTSLRHRSPRLSGLTLAGARLTLRRHKDGHISLDGLDSLPPADPQVLRAFLRNGRFNLVDGVLRLADDGLGESVGDGLPTLSGLGLRLSNRGRRHRLDLVARPVCPDSGGLGTCPADARLRVLAELDGRAPDPARWGGRVYAELSGTDLPALVPTKALGTLSAKGGRGSIEVWATLSQGALSEAIARLALQGVEFEDPAAGPGPIRLDSLKALARAARAPAGWQVSLRRLGIELDNKDLPESDLDLGLDAQARPTTVAVSTRPFDLAPLVAAIAENAPHMFARLPADRRETVDAALERILAMSPRGRIEHLTLSADLPPGQAPRWQVSGCARDLAVTRSKPLPGLSGLDLTFSATQNGGRLGIASEGLALDLAPLFDRPWRVDHLGGALDWSVGSDGGVRVFGRRLTLQNADLSGEGRFALELPPPGSPNVAGSEGPFIDLRAHFQDADGSQTRTYIPAGVVNPELVRWLERAVRGGWVPQADFALRGPLRAFPFRNQEGRFELLLEFEQGTFDYLPGWPPIEDAVGSLHFLNQGLDIAFDSGRIYGSVLSAGSAQIPNLWEPRLLPIHGEADGPLADAVRLLRETPLAMHLGRLGEALEVSGRSHLALDLSVPLRPGESLSVDGRVGLLGPAEVALKDTPLRLKDLNGTIGFTADSLRSDGLQGSLWDRPVAIEISTKNPGDPQRSATEVDARARLSANDLAARLPSPAWALAKGDADWRLQVVLRNADLRQKVPPLDFAVDSDLRGLAFDLPAPLGKSAAEARPLKLSGTLAPGRSLALSGGLAGGPDPIGFDLQLALGGSSAHLGGAHVHLGDERTQPNDSAGILVDGRIAQLDLPDWTDWWSGVGKRLGAVDQGVGQVPLAIDLAVDRLDLGNGELHTLRVLTDSARPSDKASGAGSADAAGTGSMRLRLDSQELAGRLAIPPGQGPIDLDLDRLDLEALLPPRPRDDSPAPSPAPKDRGRPTRSKDYALDLRVSDLRWGASSLGLLSLSVRPDGGATQVSGIAFTGPSGTRIGGEASSGATADGPRGRLALTLESADLGPLAHALDYARVLSPAPVKATLRLDWPGDLDGFSLTRAQGRLDLDVGAGRLLAVEPGVGRVLGILDLGALNRRLSLDFSDLYEKGFYFERIAGGLDIADGKAELRGFRIEGPSGTVRVSGTTDIVRRRFDQTVTVEPNLGGGVALAGTMAGGPVVGAAVLLVDKVSGGAIGRLGTYSYRVTGPWGTPVLERAGWEPFAGTAPGMRKPVPAKPEGDRGGGAGRPRIEVPTGSSPAARQEENLFLQ